MDAYVFDRKQERAFGKMAFDRRDEGGKSLTGERGDEDSIRQGEGQLLTLSTIEQIGFIECDDDWSAWWGFESSDFVERTRDTLARVTHVDYAVGGPGYRPGSSGYRPRCGCRRCDRVWTVACRW